MNSPIKALIVIIILAAVICGYLVYQKNMMPVSYAPVSSSNTNSSPTTPATNSTTPTPASTPAAKSVLASPLTPSSTAAERQAYIGLVLKAGVQTNNIEISGCLAKPEVALMKKDSSVTFVNKDSSSVKIAFTPTNSFTLAAGASKAMPANFGKTAGMYNFICSVSGSSAAPRLSGIVFLQ